MSEILTLAEKFKTQSKQQVTSIEQELQSATTQLNSFMTARLLESETIIKDGMDNLQLSNEQLQQMLTKHQTDINTALTTYLNNVQAHLIQDLSELKSQTETLIEDYTQHIAQLIEQREDRIAQVIKSEMKKWAIVTSLFTLSTLVLGMMIGAVLVNKFSKPIYIQQPISYAQPNYAQR